MRIACAAVLDLPLQAWRRADPDLVGAPLAISAAPLSPASRGGVGRSKQSAAPSLTSRIVALADEARALGVRVGQTVAQARAIAPSLVVRVNDPVRCEAARAALCDAASSFGARMEPDGDEVFAAVFIEVGDLGRLFPTEREVALSLVAAARAVGLRARVAVASSKGVARLAARAPRADGGVVIVAAGGETKLIAPLPISALAPSEEARAALDRWGVRTCGRLAALPPREVALRLGEEGERLAELARGRSNDPLAPRAPTDELEEGMELDFALADLEALGFVLRGLIDRLLARLQTRHLACAGLGLRLHLDPRGYDVREVGLSAPTRDPATLLEIVRLSVEKKPPAAPVVGVTLLARAARGPKTQLDLFRPAGPAPDRLAATVARLQALVGDEQVGAPSPVDTWRDEALAVTPFSMGKTNKKNTSGNKSETVNEKVGDGSGRLALRRFRPEREVEVLLDGGWPRAITGAGLSAHVVVAAGPYRVNGEWWSSRGAMSDEGFARDCWDVHASDGAVYRIYCDARRRWFLDGYYD